MAKPLISRQSIVESAAALLKEDGLDGLNMRRLAERLRCSSRTIYQQIGKREDLIREILHHHFSAAAFQFNNDQDWRITAHNWSVALRQMILDNPDIARLINLQDRAAVLSYTEILIQSLVASGLTKPQSLQLCTVLSHTVMALSLNQVHAKAEPTLDRQYLKKADFAFKQSLKWILDAAAAEYSEQRPKVMAR